MARLFESSHGIITPSSIRTIYNPEIPLSIHEEAKPLENKRGRETKLFPIVAIIILLPCFVRDGAEENRILEGRRREGWKEKEERKERERGGSGMKKEKEEETEVNCPAWR